MEYPMPENMGFPVRQTISEMLPDQLLVSPESKVGRYGKNIHVGLQEFICPKCGTRFYATSQHRYKVRIAGKEHMCCSHHCFRPYEKEMEEKFKCEALGFKKTFGDEKTPLERARDRVAACKKRLRKYQAIKDDSTAWAALSKTKQESYRKLIRVWTEKLEHAQRMLEGLQNEK